jgi:hypothetical protein
MAPARLISVSLSTSERYARLHTVEPLLAEFAQTLFPLLVVHADDHGRLQGDPFTIKFQVTPTSPRSIADVEAATMALASVGMIRLYEVDGQRYLQVAKFDAHQQGLRRRTASKFPDPPSCSTTERPGNVGKFPGIPAEEKGIEQNGIEQNGTEPNGTEPNGTEPKKEAVHLKSSRADELVALWNRTMPRPPFSNVRDLTRRRREQAEARLQEHTLEEWERVLRSLSQSRFHRGESGRGTWVASFDWVIKSPDVAVRALEGQFDDLAKRASGRTGLSDPRKYELVEERDPVDGAS